ncbi:hypothetical protein VOLCADRAFT_90316 [Volvox carteri f. nagariensis]|uniref:Uncharacterized protein n=1 Tax=Volvox carteri f. nagariensis TaxID=3068 RepID=D8TU21_VOLCA|nr:uncharacterized protein VOLCADRAFT_90316 [Volvox carteri f. nagariensis]EFJ48963.1 hypothetical protein VOLCADRAFT_90316 [Volvox carteri f. nagariensis]|eukprot:XP_002949860.1 hypothetical protein VOLCADRAFT_90316 [Volvox carteri f. nagariensis]
MDLYPGERLLSGTLVFKTRSRAARSDTRLSGNDTFVDAAVCLITSYGDRLASGFSACDAPTLLLPGNNSGILAGIGGTVALDDYGTEYITSLYLIFHPWPRNYNYVLDSFKLLDPPIRSSQALAYCEGKRGYCTMRDSDVVASCQLTATVTNTYSVTTSDAVSLTFGIASSDSVSLGTTNGTENSKNIEVSLERSSTTGQTTGILVNQGATSGIEVVDGFSVTKQRSESRQETLGTADASSWSDALASGSAATYSRQESNEDILAQEYSQTQEQSRGRTTSKSETAGGSKTLETETRSQSQEIGVDATVGTRFKVFGSELDFSVTARESTVFGKESSTAITTGKDYQSSSTTSDTRQNTRGSSQARGLTIGEDKTFSTEQTSERGGWQEVSRQNTYGVDVSQGSTKDQSRSRSLISTSERSDSSELSKQLTESVNEGVTNSASAFYQVMTERTKAITEDVTKGKESTRGTEFSYTLDTTYSSQVTFSPDKLAVSLYMSVEEYKDARYTALVELETNVRK